MEEQSHHRKIELQSQADLQFLEGNIRRAAKSKIDLHLPLSAAPEGEDALRKRVESEVDAFLHEIFTSLRRNISINGMPVTAPVSTSSSATTQPGAEDPEMEEYEIFDDRLRERLATLEAQKQQLMERVANLRRTAPQKAAKNFEEMYRAYDEEMKAEAEKRMREAESNEVKGGLELERLKRQQEVEKTWREAVEKLTEVSEGLPGTVGRLERSVGVVAYLKDEKEEQHR